MADRPDTVRMDAESVFLDWLRRLEAGEEIPFDDVLAGHPEYCGDLEHHHSQWLHLGAVIRELGGEAALSERLTSVLGESVDPRISLDAPQGDDAQGIDVEELFEIRGTEGRYRMRDEVGRGGMGAVYRVWDQDLRRHLAMKVALQKEPVRKGPVEGVEARRLARFLEEAQITAQLDHPGIVPVHDIGLDSRGRLFFTMALVRGQTFREIIDLVEEGGKGWTLTRALSVVVRVCEALEYAHAKGVLHRDVKPANVMVGKFGQVYVMDWGLAKVLGREELRPNEERASESITHVETERAIAGGDPESPLYSKNGDKLGTPGYMAPEQAEGRLDEVGKAADVYAVGAMLYHLLTSQQPYVPAGAKIGAYAVLNMTLQGPPKPVHAVREGVPAELVAICEKAMAREPEDRYATTTEIANDLQAFLEERVVRAYRTGTVAEFRSWLRRNRAKAFGLVLAPTALALVALVVTESSGRKAIEEKSEELAQSKADLERTAVDLEQTNSALSRSNARSVFDQALLLGRVGDWRRVLELLDTIEVGDGTDEIDRRLLRAKALMASSDPVTARAELEELSRRSDLGNRRGAVLLALCDSKLGDLEGADEAYALLDQAREAGLFGVDLAYSELLVAETTTEVLERSQAVLELDPFNQPALAVRGTVLFLSGRFSECRAVSETYRLLFPRDTHGYVGVFFANGFGGDERGLEESIERIRTEFGDELADDLGDLMNRLLAARAMMTLEAWVGHGGDTSTVGTYQLFVMANRARKLTKLGAISSLGPNLQVLRNMFASFRQANMSVFRNELGAALEHAEAAANAHADGGLYLFVAHLAGTQRPSQGFDQAIQWIEDGLPLYERAFETPSIYPNVRQAAAYHLAYSHSLLVEGGREEEREAAQEYIVLLLAEDSLGPTVLSMLEFFSREYMADQVLQRRVLARWRHEHPDNVEMLTRYADLELAEGNLTTALDLADQLEAASNSDEASSIRERAAAAAEGLALEIAIRLKEATNDN